MEFLFHGFVCEALHFLYEQRLYHGDLVYIWSSSLNRIVAVKWDTMGFREFQSTSGPILARISVSLNCLYASGRLKSLNEDTMICMKQA